MKRGFTLIELLVVVLIIGILSSVALPQYTKAVRKARIAEARVILRALANAGDLYILESGNSNWTSWEELSIEVPTESRNWEFEGEECVSGINGKLGCGFVARPKWESGYQIDYWSPNYDGGSEENDMAGNFLCYGSTEEGRKICKSLGPTYIEGYDGWKI